MSITSRAEASILHADLDSFYASVEQRDDPALRGRPVIVGAGVVLAASAEAKARGVRTPMPGRRALALCPDAVVVPPRFAAYERASKGVFALFRDTTPVVEPLSIDEAFLDVGGLRRLAGSPEEIAVRLRRRVRAEVGLPITVGIATTKFLAKVASAVGKPDGLLVVPAGHELEFLHPLPVERLWGVGEVTAATLHARGIATIGQLAGLRERDLTHTLGRASGQHLWALAHALDPRPVDTQVRRRSIGSQRARRYPAGNRAEVEDTLLGIADGLGHRLRAAHRVCRTVILRMRFADFSRATRSHTLPEPTMRTAVVQDATRQLLDVAWPLMATNGCTLVGLSLTNLLPDDPLQLALPFVPARCDPLDVALDRLNDRFGSGTVTRATLLGRATGWSVPRLPD